MKGYVTAGLTVLAGVAVFETALIPGLLIGGAAALAPQFLPKPRRRPRPARNATARRQNGSARAEPDQRNAMAPLANLAAKFGIKQAVAKTITFRALVTVLDFTTNYVVIGELTTAAGLSTLNLVVGPLFYLSHEAAWNYLGPAEESTVDVHLPLPAIAETAAVDERRQLTISRALAKTITYRTIATVVDFTTNYVVVGDVATAVGLSAFAFVVGPFVYLGHEKLWDYYGAPQESTLEPLALPSPVPARG